MEAQRERGIGHRTPRKQEPLPALDFPGAAASQTARGKLERQSCMGGSSTINQGVLQAPAERFIFQEVRELGIGIGNETEHKKLEQKARLKTAT